MAKKRKKRPRRPREAAPEPPRPAPAKQAVAKRRAAAADERPPAPWGSFPLIEIAVFIGIVMLAIGLIGGGDRGPALIGVGIGLAGLGGLELAIREHFGGFRSHSALLAGVPAIATLAGLFYVAPESLPPLARIAIAAAVFVATFFGFQAMFRRKAGVSVKLR
ncbi:hypothetical protein BH24ACT23_BH24ACT23_05060 [soil metagenome]